MTAPFTPPATPEEYDALVERQARALFENGPPCEAGCFYKTCGASVSSPNACGGCCSCLGGCEVEYELVTLTPRGIPSGPAGIHFCPVPGCLDIWESEATCKHAAWIPDSAVVAEYERRGGAR